MDRQAFLRTAKNSERGSLFLYLALGVVLLSGCDTVQTSFTQSVYSGPIMGTDYRVTVVHTEEQDTTGLESAIVEAMQVVNRSMSNYIDDSELSQFNRLAKDQPFVMSAEFAEVVAESQQIAEASGGAFDITLAEAINLWGFGPQGRITRQPDADQLTEIRDSVGYQKLRLKGNTLSKTHDKVRINLSAIAKGYAVDQVARVLDRLGYDRYLVNIGGELKASGKSLSNEWWRVGIEKPHITGGIQQVIALQNQAIATSGDYRNFHVIDGQHFSHTIHPTTLRPVYHRLALVSVLSDNASTADAQATALMAMGEEQALSYAQKSGLAAYLLIRGTQPDEYEVVMTEKFRVKLQ